MSLLGGKTIIITIAGVERKWRLSKIDSKLVKFFDENDNYTQMPYENFIELLKKEHAVIQSQLSSI
jgi:hypothetical protein